MAFQSDVVVVILFVFLRFVNASCEKNLKQPLDTFLCVVVVLTSILFVSRGWFRFLTFKCAEVGLGFSLLGVQRLD